MEVLVGMLVGKVLVGRLLVGKIVVMRAEVRAEKMNLNMVQE